MAADYKKSYLKAIAAESPSMSILKKTKQPMMKYENKSMKEEGL